MPFSKVLNINKIIESEKANDPDFSKSWDESRSEYRLLHDIVRERKALHLSQTELARRMGCRQQDISSFERKAHRPSFHFVCHLIDSMGYELILKKKSAP